MKEIVQNNGQNSGDLDALIDSIRTSPAIDAAKDEARKFARRAQESLAIFPANEFRRALNDLATYVVERAL
ncbi:MAG: hypothetical protein HY257_07575 [Chloroflexi bacterium]|nr:hypothetical protein [Chloroflexota bacterium]